MSGTGSNNAAAGRASRDASPYGAPTPHEIAVRINLEALHDEAFRKSPPNLMACVILDTEQLTLASKCRLVEKAARYLKVSERGVVQTAIRCGRHRQEISTVAETIFEGHDFGKPTEIDASADWLIKHDELFPKQEKIYDWLNNRESFMKVDRFGDDLAYLPNTSQAAEISASKIVDRLSAAAKIARANGPPLSGNLYRQPDKRTYLLETLSRRDSWVCSKTQEAFQEFYPAFDQAIESRWPILDRFASLGQDIDEAAKGLNVVVGELDPSKLLGAHLSSFIPVGRDGSEFAPTTVPDHCLRIVTSKAEDQTDGPFSLATVEREDLINAIETTPEPFMSLKGYEEWLRTIDSKCTEAATVRERSTKRDTGAESVEQGI
jgi:hypothetical protein